MDIMKSHRLSTTKREMEITVRNFAPRRIKNVCVEDFPGLVCITVKFRWWTIGRKKILAQIEAKMNLVRAAGIRVVITG